MQTTLCVHCFLAEIVPKCVIFVALTYLLLSCPEWLLRKV